MDEEKLIIEVENQRIIYDPTHPFYKDNLKKELAWNIVSSNLGVSAKICKAKWRVLRDAYVKSKKKVSASGSAGGTQKEWKYNEIMSFLLPYLQPRSSKSNLALEEERSATPLSVHSDEQPGCSSSIQEEWRAEGATPAPLHETTRAEREQPRRSRSPREHVATRSSSRSRGSGRQQASELDERLLAILQEPPPRPENELDEAYHFGLSLVPLLNRLDHHRRQQAKIEILNVLVRMDSSTSQPPPSTVPPSQFHTFPTQPIPQSTYPHTFITQPASNLPTPTHHRRSFLHPPQTPGAHPIGPYTEMLASNNPEWEDLTNL